MDAAQFSRTTEGKAGGGRSRPRWRRGAHPFAVDGRLSQISAGGVIEKICRAGEFWRAGEKALAQIHLAFLGLPKIDETDAYRLFLAGTALERGASPSELMKALGFPRAARNIEKYNPDQPRVPAGSGRESGEWTTGDGASGSGTAAQNGLPRNVHVKPFVPQVVGGTVSDANPDGIVPVAQYAQANVTPVITPDIIDKIKRVHGPGAKDGKGEFYAQFANAESIKWLIEEAWTNATRINVSAANKPGRVVLGATV